MNTDDFKKVYEQYAKLAGANEALAKNPYANEARFALYDPEGEFNDLEALGDTNPNRIGLALDKRTGVARTSLVDLVKDPSNTSDLVRTVTSKIEDPMEALQFLGMFKPYEGADTQYKEISEAAKDVKKSSVLLQSEEPGAFHAIVAEVAKADVGFNQGELLYLGRALVKGMYTGIANQKVKKFATLVSDKEGKVNGSVIANYAQEAGLANDQSYENLAGIAYQVMNAK